MSEDRSATAEGEFTGINGAGQQTVTERAQTMRASLGARRVAEALLAEASLLRRTAVADADTLVAEAEILAGQLVSESRQAAERTAAEAQERADSILARARAEAEELGRHLEQERARLRDEVEAQGRAEVAVVRSQSDALLRQVELGVHGLGPALEGAMSVVTDVISSLERLRSVTPGKAPDLAAEGAGEDDSDVADMVTAWAIEPVSLPLSPAAEGDGHVVVAGPRESFEDRQSHAAGIGSDDEVARPLGWLFRASQP